MPVSLAVPEAIAEATEFDTNGRGPLSDTLDPETLDELCASRPEGGELGIAFEYDDCEITVERQDDGEVAVVARIGTQCVTAGRW